MNRNRTLVARGVFVLLSLVVSVVYSVTARENGIPFITTLIIGIIMMVCLFTALDRYLPAPKNTIPPNNNTPAI